MARRKRICLQCRRYRWCGFHPWELGKLPCRRKWQSILVFLPGKFHGQRSLAGCGPRGHKSRTRLKWLSMHSQLTNSVATVLVNSEGIQPYIHIYLFSPKLPVGPFLNHPRELVPLWDSTSLCVCCQPQHQWQGNIICLCGWFPISQQSPLGEKLSCLSLYP